MHKDLIDIISRVDKVHSNIPPTLVYNEAWMLRLVLEWFATHPNVEHLLSFPSDCKWYSEALLSSPFLYAPKGTKLAEGYTHADGVVGKFTIGDCKKGELALTSDSDFIYVVEAKMSSPLSKGTKNAPTYNQAARNVACIADLLVRAILEDKHFNKLAFFVLMPQNNIHFKETQDILCSENIISVISKRLNSFGTYDNKHKSISWLRDNLTDFINNKILIEVISWENILEFINDPQLADFYQKCKLYNN